MKFPQNTRFSEKTAKNVKNYVRMTVGEAPCAGAGVRTEGQFIYRISDDLAGISFKSAALIAASCSPPVS